MNIKHILLISVLFFTFFVGCASAEYTHSGLVAMYNFSTDTGNTIVDLSGNRNNLTDSGSIIYTYKPTGVKYRKYTNDCSVGGITGLSNKSGSMEILYRVNTTATHWNDLCGLNYTNFGTGANTSLRIEQTVENGNMRFILNGCTFGQPVTSAIYANDTLAHIVVTWDQTPSGSTQVRFYVNNEFIGSGFVSSTVNMALPSGAELTLGAQDRTHKLMSIGDIYNVRLYDIILNDDQRALNYDAEKWVNNSAYTVDASKYNFNVSKQSDTPQTVSFELDRPANGSTQSCCTIS
jgi:hypothetical protein